MFEGFRTTKRVEDGTPKKKKKLNQQSTYEEEQYSLCSLSRKKSFVDTFQFIGNIKRKDSTHVLDLNLKSNLDFCNWENILKDDVTGQFKVKPFGFGEVDVDDLRQNQENDYDDLPPFKLTKKMTMDNHPLNELSFKLYRNNSTIDADDKINETEEGNYGENKFIQQIMSIKKGSSQEDKFKMNFDEDQGEEERLLKDYEIRDNINSHIKHHSNYICLNKLDKIFYYVKKIGLTRKPFEHSIHDLCNDQIRLYNKDDTGHLLRFYQSWIQDESIYLIFEIASTSILEKTVTQLKMRQNQVWTLLKDACEAIQWMYEQGTVHLNIKPGNILKCRDKFKLSDPFITLKALQDLLNSEKNEEKLRLNFAYTAPEIITYRQLLQGLNLKKADMYSLAMCIIENLTTLPIYILNIKNLRKNSEKYLKGYSPALRTTLIKMISLQPSNRPNPLEILTIQEFDFKKKPNQTRKLSL